MALTLIGGHHRIDRLFGEGTGNVVGETRVSVDEAIAQGLLGDGRRDRSDAVFPAGLSLHVASLCSASSAFRCRHLLFIDRAGTPERLAIPAQSYFRHDLQRIGPMRNTFSLSAGDSCLGK
ncbi:MULTISPECIES: hypothetical protein [Methylobacteriaceae]|uniref:hypothetical protein n=1 Tax=Methylobacteriaceae TaxID=119045 RepID=UPI002F351F8D